MDLATVIGMILGWGCIIGGFLMEGGRPGALVEKSAAVIVFGGSIGATIICFSLKHTTSLPIVLKQAFFSKSLDRLQMMQDIVSLAKKARQAGILALEGEIARLDNVFLKQSVQLVVDGTQPELVREILDTEIEAMRMRHKGGVEFFTMWGGFAPTLGVLGTVMGLVHMLENLSDPGGMGPSIATAFIATFYGVGFANMFFLPVASKLKARSHEELSTYEMAVEGILSLQAGDNPRVVSTKMRSFLSPAEKKVLEVEEK